MSGKLKALLDGARHAFAIPASNGPWEPADTRLLERLADAVRKRGMTVPALMFLESSRSLNYVGSQFLSFARPFATFVFNRDEYDRVAKLLERRDSIDRLIDILERQPEDSRGASCQNP